MAAAGERDEDDGGGAHGTSLPRRDGEPTSEPPAPRDRLGDRGRDDLGPHSRHRRGILVVIRDDEHDPDDRALLLGVLRGTVAVDSDAPFFIDDMFFFLVRRLELDDHAWLVAQLHDDAFTADRRALVLMQMTPDGQQPLRPLLFRLHGIDPPPE